jgi:hypothetical protein
MKMIIVCLMLLCCAGKVCAQPPDTLWTHTYGGGNSDESVNIVQTGDNGLLIAGETWSFGAGSSDMYIVKTAVSGAVQWTRTYGGIYGELCNALCKTAEGGFVLAGVTESFGSNIPHFNNIYVVKLAMNGDTIWTRTVGGIEDDASYSVQPVTTGGVIVAGYTRSFGSDTRHANMFLLKLAPNGDSLWLHTYGNTTHQTWGYSVATTSDGGFATLGETEGGTGSSDVYIVKTDSIGSEIWTSQFSINQGDFPCTIREISGGFIVAGSANSDTLFRDTQMFLAKLDFNGDTLWTKTYSGHGYDLDCYDMQVTLDGGFILVGTTWNPAPFPAHQNIYLIRTDSSGNLLWERQYGQSYEDEGRAIAVLPDGGYAIAGSVHTIGAAWDYYLVRTERDPALETRDHPMQAPHAIQFVTYPNPFNSACTIRFSLTKDTKITVELFDINGRLINLLLDGNIVRGTHDIKLSGSLLSSASYFVRLTGNGIQQTQRIMLIK